MKNHYTKTRHRHKYQKLICPKLITTSSLDSLVTRDTFERTAKIGAYIGIVGFLGLYATEAFAVDIEAAARAGVRPLRNTVVWIEPYLLSFAGMAGMYFSEGDLKTKAVKTGIGVGALWAVSAALISWMPNVA